MKRRKISILVTVAILLFLGLAWWFWSLGSLKPDGPDKVRLIIEKGTVLAATKKSGFETKAESGMELEAGDKVKTAAGSSAVIEAYGKAQMRLDENTSVTITEMQDGNLPFVMRWNLEAGRVWSGILRLLDLDSRYESSVGNVVATVRGTSYALGARNQMYELWADHGGVTAQNGGEAKGYVVGGQWAAYGLNGVLKERGEIASSTWANDPWIEANRVADIKFSEASFSNLRDSLGAKQNILPGAWNYGLSLWSENLHLSFAGNGKQALWARYFGRKLGQVYILAQGGKSGLAYQKLSGFERDLESVMSGKDGQKYREAVRPVIGDALLAVSDVSPGDILFRYKLSLEDLYAKSWDDDAANNFYARALAVDSRLEEAEEFDCKAQGSDAVKEAINAVEQGLARENADFEKISAGLNQARKDILVEKLKIQELRLKRFVDFMKVCEATERRQDLPLDTATTTQAATSTSATSTDSLKPPFQSTTTTKPKTDMPATATTTSAVKPVLGLVRIELTAQPNPIEVGGKANLYVKGYKRDGTNMDVTSFASYQVLGSIGSIAGSTYVSSRPGSVTIQANVPDGSMTLSSTATITVNQAVTLSSLTLKPSGATLYPGQSQNFSAIANYSNGFTKDVTGEVAWSFSNSIGSLSGSTYTAGRTAGTAIVSAKFTEDGKSVSAQATIQVVNANQIVN